MALESDLLNLGGITDRGHIIDLGLYFRTTRVAYTNNLPDYKGLHYKHDAATTESDWVIMKFTWSGADCTDIEILEGAWDSRASLSWKA